MTQRRSTARVAPSIAFLAPSEGYWTEAATHLLSSLGLPQVVVVEAGAALPASVHSVLLIGPPEWRPALPVVAVWRLAAGIAHPSADTTTWFPSLGDRTVALPNHRRLMAVTDGRSGGTPEVAGLQQALFWLRERLMKRDRTLPERDYYEWLATLQILDLKPNRTDRLLESLRAQIEERRPSGTNQQTQNGSRRTRLFSWRTAQPQPVSLDRKRVLRQPVQLVTAALEQGDQQSKSLVALLREALPECKNGYQLIAMGVAAALLGDAEVVATVRNHLQNPDWSKPRIAFPRSQAGREGLCYSPFVAAWWFLEARRVDPGFELPSGIALPRPVEEPLNWQRLSNGSLIEPDARLVSRSLLDNWLALHSAPLPAGTQYRLDAPAYEPWIAALEQIWLDVLRTIQHRQGQSLLRLRPWPAGCRAALSLRYDVDRPISTATIEQIADMQATYIRAPCASWYYFADDPNRQRQAALLSRHRQEVGIHAESAWDAVCGLGVTHHSAPTSDYWRGDATNAVLDRLGAHHCEFLAAQTLRPRPAWIEEGRGAWKSGKVWTTPIHFPLEGSTSDHDLTYFDRLLERFRDALAEGGHVIIGSHPDLDQDLLEALFRREDLSNVWYAPVRVVVERCQALFGYGSVQSIEDRDGNVGVLCRTTISDVEIEIWRPAKDKPCVLSANFMAGQPAIFYSG